MNSLISVEFETIDVEMRKLLSFCVFRPIVSKLR